jgi:hypothetical protein
MDGYNTRDIKQATHIHHRSEHGLPATDQSTKRHTARAPHRCPAGEGRTRRRHLSTIIIVLLQYQLLAARATLLLSVHATHTFRQTNDEYTNTAILASSFRDLVRSGHGHELLTCRRCRGCRCSCRRTCSHSRLRRRPRTRPRRACA